MKLALILVGVGLGLFLLDRLGLWAESRGWIYWRRRRRSGSSGADLFLDLNVLVDPGARHIIEVKQAEPMEAKTDDDLVPPPPLASNDPSN